MMSTCVELCAYRLWNPSTFVIDDFLNIFCRSPIDFQLVRIGNGNDRGNRVTSDDVTMLNDVLRSTNQSSRQRTSNPESMTRLPTRSRDWARLQLDIVVWFAYWQTQAWIDYAMRVFVSWLKMAPISGAAVPIIWGSILGMRKAHTWQHHVIQTNILGAASDPWQSNVRWLHRVDLFPVFFLMVARFVNIAHSTVCLSTWSDGIDTRMAELNLINRVTSFMYFHRWWTISNAWRHIVALSNGEVQRYSSLSIAAYLLSDVSILTALHWPLRSFQPNVVAEMQQVGPVNMCCTLSCCKVPLSSLLFTNFWLNNGSSRYTSFIQ